MRRGEYSFDAYRIVLADPNFQATFGYSTLIALATIVVGVLLVVPTAYWIQLRLPRLRPLVEFITLLPLVIPAIVIVFGYLRLYNSSSFLPLTASARATDLLLTFGYVTLALPYMYRAVDTGLRAIDVRTLTEAAEILGASLPTILFRVILPNIRTAILSGAFLTFAIVIGEFTLASLLNRPAFGPYLQLMGANRAYEPSALAIIAFLVTWACMGLINVFGRAPADQARALSRTESPRHGVSRDRRRPQELQAAGRGAELRPGGRARRVRFVPRAVRLRQDHDPAHGRRLRDADLGRHPHRRPRRHRPAPEPAQCRHGLPVLRPVPEHDRGRERRLRPEGGEAARPPRSRARVEEMLALIKLPALGGALSLPALRRPAAARGAGARPGGQAAGPACSTSRSRRSTPRSASRLREEIRALQRQLGITTIYVTHDQEEALSMSDRIVVMNDGQGRAGRHAVRDLQPSPGPASWPRSSARSACCAARWSIPPLAGSWWPGRRSWRRVRSPRPAAGNPCTLAFAPRPRCSRAPTRRDGRNRLAGTIEEVSFLGSVVRIRVRLQDNAISLDTFNNPGSPRRSAVRRPWSPSRAEDLLVLDEAVRLNGGSPAAVLSAM